VSNIGICTSIAALYSQQPRYGISWVLGAHPCNPSYSGDRDQENHGSKPARANSFPNSILKKKKSQKRAGGMAQGIGLEFKLQY
jgi:hypothetical protein